MYKCEIRDPIHGTIGVTAGELAVLDHPFVQRLRQIRQLGTVYLVYPGATHDRFSHSIGAMHVAGRMWEAVIDRDQEIVKQNLSESQIMLLGRIIRLAALLHDIGHPPFSHVSESFLPSFGSLPLPEEWLDGPRPDRQARHEDMSAVLISRMCKGDKAVLSSDDAQDICSLVHAGFVPSPRFRDVFGDQSANLHHLAKSFVSGELDADRMDYLLRDAYSAGAVYGNYDVDRLVTGQGLAVIENRLVRYVDANAVRSFEDFLLARYHMFLQVYLHKTAVGFDICLAEAAKSGELDLSLPSDPDDYARRRDSTVIEGLFAVAERPECEWSRRLTTRTPLKLLFSSESARPGDTELLARLRDGLTAAGIRSFEVSSRSYLSRIGSVEAEPVGLFARRKLLGRYVFEPIAHYSDLLKKYNEHIRITNLYIRREDWGQAKPIVEGLPLA